MSFPSDFALPNDTAPILGAGYLYFDELLDETAGTYKGERYLAETPDFELMSKVSQRVKEKSSDGPIATVLIDAPSEMEREGKFGLRNCKLDNLALFLVGTAGTVSTTAATLTAQVVNAGKGVYQGHWYQLGVTTDRPAGTKGVDDVSVKTGQTTYDITDDYLLDEARGRIYIVPGGGIANGTVVTSDHKTTAVSWAQLVTVDTAPKRGRLRFIAHNTQGADRDYWIPDVWLMADGSLKLKSRTEIQSMGFTFSVQKPAGLADLYIDGQAAAT